MIRREIPGGALGTAWLRDRAIIVSPSGYHARDEFTLAHELMELHVPGSWRRDLPAEMKEAACDRGAAALLLPAHAFCASIDDLGWNLPTLRRQWKHASWSTIARRMVDVGAATTAAAWDDLELRWRYGADGNDGEEEALGRVYAGRGFANVANGARTVRAWRLGGAGLGRAVSIGR